MVPQYTILCAFFGFVLAKGCEEKGKQETFGCLKKYFNDTKQEIPAPLETILNYSFSSDDLGAGRSRRQTTGAEYKVDNQFKNEWCSPFKKYESCVDEAVGKCRSAAEYVCRIMTSFDLKFGNTICDIDISKWTAKNIRACMHISVSSGSRSLTHTRVWAMVAVLRLLVW